LGRRTTKTDVGHAERLDAGTAPWRANAGYTQPKDNFGRPDDGGAGRMFDVITKRVPVQVGK
jgi:hypothetical protein